MTQTGKLPIYSGATPAQVAEDLAVLVDFQPDGVPLANLTALITERLLPHLVRYDRPQFQSMFNAFPPAEARLGAQVALDFNQGVTNWQVSPGGAMLEELCAQALCRLFGLGQAAGATFMYSGTYGNQQGLYLALHKLAERHGFDLGKQGIAGFETPDRLAVLVAEDAHFSVRHAVRMLGLGERCLVVLPSDQRYKLDAKQLQETWRELNDERDIIALVATAGSTSTGAVDPIDQLADICAETGTWLHLDGAYGYAYKLVHEWSHLFAGDFRADSITWDPHKQLGAPIPNSVLFVKDQADFGRMALYSHYFNRPEETVPNPGLKSPPSTRPMSALPLVTILRGQGLDRVIRDLRSPLVAVRALAEYLRDLPDVELCHEPETGIICFRMTPPGISERSLDDLQQELYVSTLSGGLRTISITRIGGKSVLRLVSVSPLICFTDFKETIEALRQQCRRLVD